jgi:DNA-binding transcriptional ArsR family regulator
MPAWDDILFFSVPRTSTKRPPKPSATPSASHRVWTILQWRALRSPIRLELFTLAEGAAPCSVADLARLSGRRPSSLYRHIAPLVRAKLLVAVDRRRAGRRYETIYGLGPMGTARSIGTRPDRLLGEVVHIAERAFRTASRDIRAAVQAGHVPRLRDPSSPLAFFFEVTWLDDRRRRELHAKLQEILAIIRAGRAARTGLPYRVVSSFVPLASRMTAPARTARRARVTKRR